MWKSLFIAIAVIVFLMVIWLLVQKIWKITFEEYVSDEDVLAERRSCGNCGCTQLCDRHTSHQIEKEIIFNEIR